jgi:hypothetical protein
MLWGLVGEATGMYLRAAFFRALMQQEVGFFETERLCFVVFCFFSSFFVKFDGSVDSDAERRCRGCAVANWRENVGTVSKHFSNHHWNSNCICVSAKNHSKNPPIFYLLFCFDRYSWKLTLVLIAVSPLIALAAVLQGKLLALGATKTAIANQVACFDDDVVVFFLKFFSKNTFLANLVSCNRGENSKTMPKRNVFIFLLR